MTDTEEADCGWEEVYRAMGVRCDIEVDVSSLDERGVCPTPLVNPFPFSSQPSVRWSGRNIASLDVFA